MIEFWRDLCVAIFAWLLGILAVHYYPISSMFTPAVPSEYFTMIMFKPYNLLFTGICLVLASYILYILLGKHGKQMFFGRIGSTVYQLLHILLFFFCIYILWIQGNKFPASTFFLFLVFVFIQHRKIFYNVALRVRFFHSKYHKK